MEGRKIEKKWMERIRDGCQDPEGLDFDNYIDELQRRIDKHPYQPGIEDAQEITKKIQIALNKEIGL